MPPPQQSKLAYDTPGRIAFRKWLQDNGVSYSKAAARLRVTKAAVGNWCAGSHRPDTVYRKVIEQWTGIERSMWLTDPESELAQRLIDSL
jgi:transcriptional regulator with XRE-family HTH domain